MPDENGNYRIGLIGGPSSGKTTMLLALEKYARKLIDKNGIWTYSGADKPSIDWLDEKRLILREGKFAEPTTYMAQDQIRVVLYRDAIKVKINTQDRPGGDYVPPLDENMLEYLAECDGLIFLISPKPKEGERNSEMIRNLLTHIDLKRGNGEVSGLRMPHRVAVCLSQYDDAEFFQWLRDNGYLEKSPSTGIRNTPILPSKNVIKAICKWKLFPDGQDILDEFGTRFFPENVNFFALSSIGFWKEPGTDHINWDNCGNVVVTGSGAGIRSGSDYTPVMLLAPYAWILSKDPSDWRGY